MLFGVLQALTNLGFMALATAGKSYPLMILVIAAENLCGGMGTAAFVALLMAMCDRRFSATQYALLSALASLGRVYVGPAAGAMAAQPGLDGVLFLDLPAGAARRRHALVAKGTRGSARHRVRAGFEAVARSPRRPAAFPQSCYPKAAARTSARPPSRTR